MNNKLKEFCTMKKIVFAFIFVSWALYLNAQKAVHTLYYDQIMGSNGYLQGMGKLTIFDNRTVSISGKSGTKEFNYSFDINSINMSDGFFFLYSVSSDKDSKIKNPNIIIFLDGVMAMYSDNRNENDKKSVSLKSSHPEQNRTTIDAIKKSFKNKTGLFANYRSVADIELPLTIEGHSPTYSTTISPIGDDKGYVYSVRTKTGKYVDDTSLKEYEVTSDSYWAKIDVKTESAFLVRTLDNNTGSSRKATIKVSAGGVTTEMYITQPAMKACVKKVWIEHNKWSGLIKGMKIHVSFETYGVRGMTGTCAAYFSFANGQKLMDYNGMFRAMDGQVSCGENFRPGYDSSTYNDFVLFMPYSELHINGKADCKVDVEVQIDGQAARGESIGFTMN